VRCIVKLKYFLSKLLRKRKIAIQRQIPTPLPSFSDYEAKIIEIYQNEWRTIIQTQMHFNDLLVRLRTVTITALATLVGAAVAIIQIAKLRDGAAIVVFWAPWFIWLIVFVLDFFYYHRLLIGSVKAALKFDDNKFFQKQGLFGMTQVITDTVTPPTSRWMIGIYYFAPFMVAIIVFVLLWRTNIIKIAF